MNQGTTPPMPQPPNYMQIEQLLNEFYYPATNNLRKREIEQQLVEYQNVQNVWPQSLCNLSNTTNQYLWFFNVSTVEVTITKKWNCLKPIEKQQIRETLWTTYANLTDPQIPKIQREKIAQLLALMGKREFPDEHSTYASHIIELLQINFNLGIILLRTTSEELVSTRDDVCSDTKKKFHSALSICMPEVFELIRKFLIISSSRINAKHLNIEQQNVFFSNLNDAMPSDDTSFNVSVVELLSCIQHLFSWISLDDFVNDNLIYQLFDLGTWRECASDVSAGALVTISELFYRQIAMPCVQSIAKGIRSILESTDLKKSNELYQDKLTELLKLFTTQHWSEWVNNESMQDIITALYHFTFSGYGALAFTERLSIWSPLIRGLSTSGLRSYNEIVQILVVGILRKMQFRFDQESELDILDNESLDDDMETEWQHYLTQCIETIVLIAEGRPYQVFEQVYSQWQRPFEMFMTLEKSHNGSSLTIVESNKCHLIHCVTRDLSSLCQTLTSLLPVIHLANDVLPLNIHHLTNNLIDAIRFLSISKLHNLEVPLPQLTADFIEIYAQLLSALRSFFNWYPIIFSDAQINALIESVASALLPPVTTIGGAAQEPTIITLAAAQFLLSVTSTLRPKSTLDSVSFKQLIQFGPNLSNLDPNAANYTHQSIVNCMVLPWQNMSNADQDFERRAGLLQEYIQSLAQDLLRQEHTFANGQQDKIVKITTTILPTLQNILDYFKEQCSSVKNMLLTAYRPVIFKSLSLFNNYGSASAEIANSVLTFSLSVIRTLQVQLGTAYVKEMLSVFLEATTREQITRSRLKAVDMLLQMLLLVVEQPGGSTLTLLPAILSLSLDYVAPLLGQDKNSTDFCDVAISLFALFDGILHHRWQYFYKSQVLRGFSPAAIEMSPLQDDGPQHPEQLLAILTAYGQAIVASNDMNLTRFLLTSLSNLNERFKLFNRDFFKQNLLTSFHCALINALISPEGSIHIDLLYNVLFTMGQVNNATFHASFVSLGYSSNSKMIADICLAADLPTFSQKMAQLIQDTRCRQFSQ